jgi:hypothetical protein
LAGFSPCGGRRLGIETLHFALRRCCGLMRGLQLQMPGVLKLLGLLPKLCGKFAARTHLSGLRFCRCPLCGVHLPQQFVPLLLQDILQVLHGCCVLVCSSALTLLSLLLGLLPPAVLISVVQSTQDL